MTVVPAADRPLRVLHYLPAIRLDQGGVVRAVLDWCEVMAARGHAVALVVYDGRDLPAGWLAAGPGKPRATVVPPPRRPAKLLGRAAMAVVDAELARADVLHLHAPWLDGNRQIAAAARRRGVPYVVSLHGMLDDWSMGQKSLKKRVYLALLGRRWLEAAAVAHCTAEAELGQVTQWFTPRRTAVLPCLVDLSAFEQLPGPALGTALLPEAMRPLPRLLFLSRLHHKKGTDVLIRAAGLLRQTGRPVALAIAGVGEPAHEAELRALVAELGLADQVVFLGLVTGPAKLSLYQSADLFVLPTRDENFGMVLVEAMACGTAVVTTRGTAIWPQVEAAGGAIADGTPHAVAATIGRLLDHPDERAERAARGRRWVFEHMAVDTVARGYERLYRDAIAAAGFATETREHGEEEAETAKH